MRHSEQKRQAFADSGLLGVSPYSHCQECSDEAISTFSTTPLSLAIPFVEVRYSLFLRFRSIASTHSSQRELRMYPSS